ncbi:hypothetical protein RHGRI_026755 [Rhododendron griersonianum]|uniref:Uncharacterized protein n=1 Tax=Rhododendron griersonianum TaxID=479676 RepID=A0AAV6IZH6_9ERIC|nr:hypothetical protein RHGRI_026755 [Rhododendron griersonianum]
MAYATARLVVTVQTFDSYTSTDKDALPMPSVMKAPIRPDIVTHVHSLVSKNSRQPYAVSAKSWQLDIH